MLKVLKIRSIENAEYTTQQNRMRFKIPGDNLNTHLNESYLSFEVIPIDSTTKQDIGRGVNVGFGNDDKAYYPTCLLKIVRLFRGDSNIPLEEIQHFNMLDQTMKIYEKDFENLISDQYESGFYVADTNQGSWSSVYSNGKMDVHIYLKDIFGLCQNKDFYLSDTAGLQIEFELEDRYKLFDTLPPNDPEGVSNLPSTVSVVTVNPTTLAPLRIAHYPTTASTQQTFKSNDGTVTIARPAENSTGSQAQKGRGLSGGAKSSKDKVSAVQDAYLFRLNEAIAPTFTYSATPDLLVATVTVATTITSIPQFYGTNNRKAGLQCIPDVATSNQYLNSALQNLTGAKLYYKTSSGQAGMSVANITGLSYTDFALPSTPAKLIVNIPTTSSTLPTNWIVYAVGIPESPSSRASATGHIRVADGTPTGLIPGDVPSSLYCVNSLKAMGEYSTSIVYTPATTSAPATYKFNTLDSDLVIGNRYQLNYFVQGTSGLGGYVADPDSKPASFNAKLNAFLLGTDLLFLATAVDTLVLIDAQKNQLIAGQNGYDAFEMVFANETNIFVELGNLLVFASLSLKDLDFENQSSQLGTVLPENITYRIPRAELVFIQSPKQSSDEPPKVYTTWKMEPALIDYETSTWQRQFILEPNVYNACFLSPELFSTGSEPLFSQLYNIGSYRWSLDNIDNTNRDVVVNKGLHGDKLMDWFNNSPMKLKSLVNYGEEYFGFIPMKIYTAMDMDNMYMNNKNHTLQLVLNSQKDSRGNDIKITPKNVYVFKEMLKTL